MPSNGSTILITGGTGYIAPHMLFIFKKGFNVISLDSLINSSNRVNKNIKDLLTLEGLNIENNFKFIKGDIRDQDLLKYIFNAQIKVNSPINAVIHLAGLKSVKQSKLNPLDYWSTNVGGSINIFNVMRAFKCKSIVFSRKLYMDF